MSYQVKGVAVRAMTGAIALLFLLLNSNQLFVSGQFLVGDQFGWTFGVSSWGQEESFHPGYVLVFKYPRGQHNVANVDLDGYKNCHPRLLSPILNSGEDQFTITYAGFYFFISTIDNDCKNGLKLAILVLAQKP